MDEQKARIVAEASRENLQNGLEVTLQQLETTNQLVAAQRQYLESLARDVDRLNTQVCSCLMVPMHCASSGVRV